MKEKLQNLKRLRGLMLLVCMCVFGAGTAWGDTKTDVIDNSVTSSILGSTGTSAWHTDFSITGASSAKYFIHSMGTTGTSNALQWNKNGYLYMTDTPSGYKLKSVKITTTADKKIGVYAQNDAYSAAPTSTALSTLTATSSGATYTFTSDYTYLALKGTESSTSITSIEIVWEESGGIITPTYTVTYDANGGTGTMTDDNSPYQEDDEVTLLTNTFTAPESMMWKSWEVKDADNSIITVTDGKFTMPASNVTVKALWVTDPDAPQYNWVETNLSDLTADDVFVIVGNSYAMTNDNGTSDAPATLAVTIDGGKITSKVANNIRWNVSGSATEGYTFYPNGSTTTWLYCNTAAGSGSNNNMRVGVGDRKVFELDRNNYLVTNDDNVDRYLSIYSNQDWRGYINTDNAVAITFYKRVDADAPQQPTITASNVNIGYNETIGNIAFTINNEVTGGAISVTTQASWISLGNETSSPISFTCDANTGEERTATVTLIYTYNTDETVTKEITVTQAAAPVIYTTIPDIFAAATNEETPVNVTFNNWVVSGVSTNGKNVFVTDNNGNGFVIFDNNGGLDDTYAVGNILSGTAVVCTLKKYNGFAELLNLDATDLTITTGGTVTASNIAMASLAGVNTGALVSYENLTCSVDNNKYYLTDGTTTLQVYNALFAFDALETGKTYSITGVYQQYNSTKEIMPRSAVDIVAVEVQHEDYTLTVSDLANVNTFVFNAADDSEMLLEGEGSIVILDGTEVLISVDVEEGYVLQSLIVDGTDVTSQIESGAYTFIMPKHAVTVTATATIDTPVGDKTLTNANIVAAGEGGTSYAEYSITDTNGKTWNAYAIKNKHSNATSDYHYLQIKKYASNTAYYIQVPEYGTKITRLEMTVSGSNQSMTGGGNSATLFFSADNSTSAAGEGVASGTGANTVTIDCSGLNLNTGYITASGAVRIWDVTVTYEVPEAVEITISTAGAASFSSQYPLDFTNSGLTANIITGKNGNYFTSQQVMVVPANTGLVVEGAADTYNIPVAAADADFDDVKDNLLVSTASKVFTVTPDDYGFVYGLAKPKDGGKVGFQKKKVDFTFGIGKSYLRLPATSGAKGVEFIYLNEVVTGIKTVGNEQMESGNRYNLNGQRVDKNYKGVVIVNGKKMINK